MPAFCRLLRIVAELIKFIHNRHFRCNIIGMIKMGKTKYMTYYGDLTATNIIERVSKSKEKLVKYSWSIGYYYASVKTEFAGVDVQIFFFRKGRGSWNAILTTDNQRSLLRHKGRDLGVHCCAEDMGNHH